MPATALHGEVGSWPDAVVALDSRKPCPVKIFADMPHTGRLCNTRLVSPGESQEYHGDDRSWGAAGASPTGMPGDCLGREPLPRAGSMFAAFGAGVARRRYRGATGCVITLASLAPSRSPQATITQRQVHLSPAGRVTTGKYAADMPRGFRRHTRLSSSPPGSGAATALTGPSATADGHIDLPW